MCWSADINRGDQDLGQTLFKAKFVLGASVGPVSKRNPAAWFTPRR